MAGRCCCLGKAVCPMAGCMWSGTQPCVPGGSSAAGKRAFPLYLAPFRNTTKKIEGIQQNRMMLEEKTLSAILCTFWQNAIESSKLFHFQLHFSTGRNNHT